MAFALNDDDINGSIHTIGLEGQQEERHPDLTCWIPHTDDLPAQPAQMTPEWGEQNREAWADYLSKVYALNYTMLMRDHTTIRGQDNSCKIVAYMRTQLVRSGRIKPGIAPATKHCKYSLVESVPHRIEYYMLNAAGQNALSTAFSALAGANQNLAGWCGLFSEELSERGTGDDLAVGEIVNTETWRINPAVARRIREQLTDIVCIVAYVFRARAHHFQDGYEETYNRIFKGTVFSGGQETCGVSWEIVARTVMKAVYPIDLDDAWLEASEEGSCSGNLALRVDCAPAGCASIVAIRRGAEDLMSAFPQLRHRFNAHIGVLEGIEDQINAHRWAGSINHTYYGVARAHYNEGSLSSLAACIMAALDSFARNAPLQNSAALKRVSQNAPITGAILTRILTHVADSDAMVNTFLPNDDGGAGRAIGNV